VVYSCLKSGCELSLGGAFNYAEICRIYEFFSAGIGFIGDCSVIIVSNGYVNGCLVTEAIVNVYYA
jgi:hypothetical protein